MIKKQLNQYAGLLLSLVWLTGCSGTATIDSWSGLPAEQFALLHDTDEDGVINEREQCQLTPHGSLVDNVGCPEYQSEMFSRELQVYFEYDSARLRTGEKRKLIDFIKQVQLEHDGWQMVAGAHASPEGSTEYNQALSQRRAQAVIDFLQGHFGERVPEMQIRTFGEGRPVSLGEDESSLQKNRRVTFFAIRPVKKVVPKWHVYIMEPEQKQQKVEPEAAEQSVSDRGGW